MNKPNLSQGLTLHRELRRELRREPRRELRGSTVLRRLMRSKKAKPHRESVACSCRKAFGKKKKSSDRLRHDTEPLRDWRKSSVLLHSPKRFGPTHNYGPSAGKTVGGKRADFSNPHARTIRDPWMKGKRDSVGISLSMNLQNQVAP